MDSFPKKRTKRGARNLKKTDKRWVDEANPNVVDTLLWLDDHRLLRTSHFTALSGRSPAAVTRQLRKLLNHGYVGAVDRSLEHKRRGNLENVYALGDEGGRFISRYWKQKLSEYTDRNPDMEASSTLQGRLLHRHAGRKVREYVDLNRKIKPLGVTHTLLISDFLVKVQKECRLSEGKYSYIHADEVFAAAPASLPSDPMLLKVMKGRDALAWRPDALFGIRLNDEPDKSRNRLFYFLEADAGTLKQGQSDKPDERTNYKKYEGYFEFNRLKAHQAWFGSGFRNYRVLFLTDRTNERAIYLLNKVRELHTDTDGEPLGWRQWLFASSRTMFDEETKILSEPWLNGRWSKSSPENVGILVD